MVRPLPVHLLEREGLGAEVGSVAERDRQVDAADRVRLHARQDAVKGKDRGPQVSSWDPHGFQGVDVEDVEAAAPVHQHIGQAHVADDGVDDERVAPKSRDAGRMVILIENDGRGRPLQLSGNRTRGSTYLAKSHLLLSPGAFVLQAADDDQAPVHVRELSFRRLLFVLVGIGPLVAAVAVGLGCPAEEALYHVTIAMVGSWPL